MKPQLILTSIAGLLLAPCQGKAFPKESDASPESSFQHTLARVNAQCPTDYPEIVTPLPEAKDFGQIETNSLMKMLESWNPSLREQAAKALSERGKEVMGYRMGQAHRHRPLHRIPPAPWRAQVQHLPRQKNRRGSGLGTLSVDLETP